MEHDLFLKRYSIVLGVVALLLVLLLFVTVSSKKSSTATVELAPVVSSKQVVKPVENNSEATAKVQVLEPNATKATVVVEKKK